jgi:hypothetical protein
MAVQESPKRKIEYAECQKFIEVVEHAIFYPSKTRWLAMEQVVKRLLEQWDALKIYFQSMLADNIPTTVSIHEGLGNVKLRLFYLFLGYILPVVNELNLEFQSESVRVHQILKKVNINLRSPNNLRPYKNTYTYLKIEIFSTPKIPETSFLSLVLIKFAVSSKRKIFVL